MAEGLGSCTWPYAVVDGVRTHISDAARMQHGICPVCGAELVARKGKFREDHWWHVNGKKCDPWYQPKGPWHLYWQNMFPQEWQEVVVEAEIDGNCVRHIADVKTPGGVVLEVQYSAISPENIAAREAFYGNMLWLASMRRIESDMDVLTALKRNGPYGVGEDHAWVIDSLKLISRQKWCLATKPVAFDFAGWFEQPESEEHLFCLLPSKSEEPLRICVEVDRHKLMEALRGGSAGRMFRTWKDAVDGVIDRYKADKQERREKAEAESRAAREQRRKETERRLAERERERAGRELARSADAEFYQQLGLTSNQAYDFITGGYDLTIETALSLGWVEAYLICCEKISYDSGVPPAGFELQQMGRTVVHFVNGYTYDEFKRDVEKAKQNFGEKLSQTLDFEKLRKWQGKVVAAVDYFVYGGEGKGGVILRNVCRMKRQFDLWTQKVGFSQISEKQSELFSAYDNPFDSFF